MYRNVPIKAIRGAKVRLFIETAITRFSKKHPNRTKNVTFKII